MLLDTNILIRHIRQDIPVSAKTLVSVVVAAELRSFALKADWGNQKVRAINLLVERFPPIEITDKLIDSYALIDAYSQGKLKNPLLPPGTSARNMGKNDLWIAATALYFDLPLHTTDRDFDHLGPLGLRVVRP